MRPFFIWSHEGSGFFLAKRLQDEGRDVLFYADAQSAKQIGKGLIPIAEKPNPPKGSIVIFDSLGHADDGAKLRAKGYAVIGGNALEKQLEEKRDQASEIVKSLGIAEPETYRFKNTEEAKDFLEYEIENPSEEYFMKLSGSDVFESSTFSDIPEMLKRYLDWWKNHSGTSGAFILQKKIEDATEVSCEIIFDGRRWVPPATATIEEKRFMTGDLSVRTGCESNMVWPLEGDKPRLARETVLKLLPMLSRTGYCGFIDQNSLITPDGVPHWIEFSSRCGFDALQAYSLLIEGSFADQLEAFALGKLDQWELRRDVIPMTLRMTTEPYPMHATDNKAHQYFRGLPLDPYLLEDPRIMINDVQLDDYSQPVLAASDGIVAVLGTIGTNLNDMREELLELAKDLRIPNKQYRIDPVSRAERDIAALADMGYISNALVTNMITNQRRKTSLSKLKRLSR